jgi:formylmethanofuran dehydrogenase subunit D
MAVSGCKSESPKTGHPVPTAPETRHPQTAAPRAEADAPEQDGQFEDARFEIEGGPSWRLRWSQDGVEAPVLSKLKVKEDGKTLFKVNRYADRVKVKNEQGDTLVSVKGTPEKFKVESEDGTVLFEVKARDDGGYKIVDGQESLRFKLKLKDDAVKVEDATGSVLYKAKKKTRDTGLEIVFRKGNDGTENVAKFKPAQSEPHLLATAMLYLDGLNPAQRAGVFAFLTSAEGR